MRRLLLTLPIAVVLFMGATAPVYAANLPLLNPDFSIVPTECRSCPCGYVGAFQLIQNLMNAGIAVGIIAFILVVVYAGATFMLNPTNPESRTKARGMFMNVVVGMVIVLAAWLVVDFVMKILYNADHESAGVQFGPWNEILSPTAAESWCIEARTDSMLIPGLGGSFVTGILGGEVSTSPGGGGGGAQTGNGPVTPATRGVCTPTGLQQAGWPSNLAARMSCVTRYENASCNASAPSGTDIGRDGNSVSIGLFQINISANNLNYPACTQLNGGQPLNCTQAFGGGAYTASNHNTFVRDQRRYQLCRAAASNPACNTAAAITIYNSQGIGAWGRPAQRNCSGL